MKAIVNIPRRLGLYYTVGALATPRVLVYNPSGTLVDTLLMSTSADSSNLHWTQEPFIFTSVGTWTLKFQHVVATVYTTIATEEARVGVDHISDVELSLTEGHRFRLDDGIIGDTTSNVTAKIVDLTGVAQGAGAAEYAVMTGNVKVDTIAIDTGDTLQIKIDALASKTATFLAVAASVLGVGGTFASPDSNTTADVSINGGAAQAIDMTGVAGGIAAWVASLDSQITGANVTDSGGEILITTTRLGTSAKVTLSNFGTNFAVKAGLTAATTVSVPASSNVADSTAVTFAEIKTVLEDGIKLSAVGDILGVTQDEDSYLVWSARSGTAGASSIIDLESGTATLIASLGFSDLGSQGSKAVKTGTAAELYSATYFALDSAFSFVADPIGTAGPYYVLWYDDGVLASVVDVLGTTPRGYELVKLTLASTEGTDSLSGSSLPHSQTDVLLSKLDGTPISQSITDYDGEATLTAPPGSYVLSVQKTGVLFSRNNVTLTVVDTEIAEGDNRFELASDYFVPTFSATPTGPDMCTMYGYLYDFTGLPLTSASIMVSLVSGPKNLAGSGTFGTSFIKNTDMTGYVEFSLVRGVDVQITVAPSSLRRTISVPSETITIAGSTAADPTVLTTSAAHSLISGETVTITGHSVDAVNGAHVVTVISPTTFSIPVEVAAPGTAGTLVVSRADFIGRLSSADDPFDVVIITTPTAPRRSM